MWKRFAVAVVAVTALAAAFAASHKVIHPSPVAMKFPGTNSRGEPVMIHINIGPVLAYSMDNGGEIDVCGRVPLKDGTYSYPDGVRDMKSLHLCLYPKKSLE